MGTSGTRPTTEPGPDQEAALGRLAGEFLDRLARGEDPSTQEYAAAHPDLADLIRDGFPLLRAINITSGSGRAGPPPARFGEFRILRLVGRGGMGVVYEAVQESLGRRVALKVLSAGRAADPVTVERFRREARTAAGLHHTNIVPVFAVGEQDGVPFYAMQFIDGRPLDRVGRAAGSPDTPAAASTESTGRPAGALPEARPPRPDTRSAGESHYRAVAGLGLQAAEAVEHAHKQGVLHRDLKPSNLLLDSRGTVWVTDFGLAKAGEGPDLTATGDVVGTLRYLAPERFHGACDARSDVYSLGATLFELLAGRPAFGGAAGAELVGRITAGRLPSLRALDRRIPRDLETVVRTAMALAPADRYPSAADLAEDLRRFLAGRPVRARRALWGERAARWCRRNPAVALTGCFAAACLLAGLVLVQWERSRHAEARALAERQARLDLEAEHYFRTIALAERDRAAGNVGRAEQLLEECPPEFRRWEWYYLRRAPGPPAVPWSHPAHLYALDLSPGGDRLVVGGSDGSLTVWATATGEPARLPRAHSNQVRGVAFRPDGGAFASAGWDGYVRVWSADGRRVWERRVGGYAFSAAFDPAGRVVAASYAAGPAGYRIARWDADTGDPLPDLPGHPTVVRRIRFSPDGSRLVTGDDAGWVKVWDTVTGHEVAAFRAHGFMIFDLAFSRDGRRLVTAAGQFYMIGEAGEVKVFETEHWGEVSAVRANAGAFYAVAVSPDGARLATGGEDTFVRVWDAGTGRETLALRGHTDGVWGVAFGADGGLYSAGGDHAVRYWDGRPTPDPGPPGRRVLIGHEGRLTALAFHPRVPVLASADMTGAVRVWDAERGTELRRLPGLPGQAHCAAFRPDGRRLAVGVWAAWPARGRAGIVAVFDTDTWAEVARLPLDPIGVLSVAYSPDGERLAAACDFSVAVVRADTGEDVWRARRENLVTAVAYLPDGSLAAGDAEGTVVLYRGATGEVLRSLPGHAGRLTALAASRDGRRFASAGVDGAVRAWDAATWHELHRPPGHAGGAYAVALDADGRRLISGGVEGSVRVWDLDADREVGTLCSHTDTVHALAVSGDGRVLGSAGRDRTILLWDLAAGAGPR